MNKQLCVNCVHYYAMHPLFNSYRSCYYCAVESEVYPDATQCHQFVELNDCTRSNYVVELSRSSQTGG